MVRILEEINLNTPGSKETKVSGRRVAKISKYIDEESEGGSGAPNKGLCHNVYDDEEEARVHEVAYQTEPPFSQKKDRNSARDAKLTMSQLRKRRRSSARFLRMSGRFTLENGEDESKESDKVEEKNEHLGEMYRQVLRMNAENKINASNSWGLKLIENIDKFLEDDITNESVDVLDSERSSGVINVNKPVMGPAAKSKEQDKRINFTKASCTIDASVKIYSYRVDDVYLSSYKVLANLNRSDGSHSTGLELDNTTEDQGSYEPDNKEGEKNDSSKPSQKKVKQYQSVSTLEENLANINVTKLDFAFDIDPLFHKMSQQFDEGGAKGLLLVNLGVASDGCRLVLDSKEDTVADFDMGILIDDDMMDLNSHNILDTSCVMENDGSSGNDEHPDQTVASSRQEGIVDVTKLRDKLQELIRISPLESIELVPQLSELRSEHDSLKSLGFLDDTPVTLTESKRYANDDEDEKAAEIEIHRQALEKSQISLNRPSDVKKKSFADDDHYVDSDSDKYDGGFYMNDYDDDDDNDDEVHGSDDVAPASFLRENDEIATRGSADPIVLFISQTDHSRLSVEPSQSHSLLDAVCSGDLLPTQTTFSFFNTDSLDKFISGNVWAGSGHLKNAQISRVDNSVKPSRKKSSKKKDATKKKSTQANFVDLYAPIEGSMNERVGPVKKGNKSDSFTLKLKSRTDSDKNILPLDAGISVRHLTMYFLRQNDSLSNRTELEKDGTSHRVTVTEGDEYNDGGFTYHGDDDSCGEDSHDGPAYSFPDNKSDNFFADDDLQVDELQNIRKINKVEVFAHSVVSKRVDVKRLKNSLWNELDSKLSAKVTVIDSSLSDEMTESDQIPPVPVSFRETVQQLTASQTQESVSFAFYFICVLHLANENSLQLENAGGLSDFTITRS